MLKGLTARGRITAAFAAASLLASAAVGHAQDYPNRTIKIEVGFPAGGGVDTTARIVAQALSESLGQPVIVENKPGAAGTIGANDVARHSPDGYTLLLTPGGHSIFGAIFKTLPFDTVKSFDWISNIVTLPLFVVVPEKSEFRSLSDIIAKAKSAPGTVTFGSAGQGTTHHLGVELLAIRSGVKFLHVPYRGDAPLMTALLAGEVQFGLATPTLLMANVKAGRVRALATTASVRSAAVPDVPTVNEALGIKNYDVTTWFGLAGPAGMPPAIVAKLNSEVRKALAKPDVRARLAVIGGDVAPSSPAEMHDKVARELETWTETVNKANIPKQ